MRNFLSIAVFLMCLSGCDFIPLYELEGNVLIDIDYQLEQQVFVREGFDPSNISAFNEKVHGKMPEYVQVQFYESGTHTLVTDEFLEAPGGMMNVPVGSYDILIYSLHTKVTEVQGNTLSGMNAFTSRTYKIGGYQSVIAEPDHLYLARVENVNVGQVKDDIHTITYVDAHAASILETWTIEMLDVDGLEYIAECELFLTCQEGRSFLWGNRLGNQPGALKINPYPDFQSGRLYSVFNTFGRYENYIDKVSAVLRVKNTAGNEYFFEFNVTDQFDDPDNVGHNIVISDLITIPSDGGSGGGFTPVVDPWWDPEIVTN